MSIHVRDRLHHVEDNTGILVALDVDGDDVWTTPEPMLDRKLHDWREMTPSEIREWCWETRETDDAIKVCKPTDVEVYTAGNWIDCDDYIHCNNCHRNLDDLPEWAHHFATECDRR